MSRRAFTLAELLVVIGIIVALAALLLPVLGMIRTRAKEALCRNNLQQIGSAITLYRSDQRDGLPPGSLTGLFLNATTATGGPNSDQLLAGEGSKSLRCPFDVKNGASQEMGMQSWLYLNTTVTPVYDLRELYEAGSSYCYETSKFLALRSPGPYDWFFPSGRVNGWPDVTWADGKAYQLKHGNANNGPFRQEFFPVVRCWHHDSWPVHRYAKKVLNVAWDGSVFWCAPSGGSSPQSPDRWEALAQ